MSIELIRTALKAPYQTAKNAHPGLLIQKGYPSHDEQDKETKTKHIQRICAIPADPFYSRAYDRWLAYTSDPKRFAALVLNIQTRLLIGLSGGGMLETGCAIHHSYGVPYIPGSSIKGILTNHVRRRSDFGDQQKAACDLLFGTAADPDSDHPDGRAGLFSFHDAWWVPNSAKTPLVQDVVTTHHPDYYGHNGETAATDFDSPVPNAQIGVQGSFLFTLEGPEAWLELGIEMLKDALEHQGIGAKTRSGYGLMQESAEEQKKLDKTRAEEQKKQEDARKKHEALIAQAANDQRRAALSPLTLALEDLNTLVQDYQQTSLVMQKTKRPQLLSQINDILALQTLTTEERHEAANQLKAVFDQTGWGDPGEKATKKEKQKNKRMAAIEAFLAGATDA